GDGAAQSSFCDRSAAPATEDPMRAGHGGRNAPREVRDAGGLALDLPQPLRTAVGEIHDAVTPGAPTVVGAIPIRPLPPDVIAVICHLVIQVVRLRMHFVQPL